MRIVVIAFLTVVTMSFVSCSTTKPLYNWAGYEQTAYGYLKNLDPPSEAELIKTYQTIIAKKADGTRNAVPPGVYADYGYLLLKEGKVNEGRDLLAKEIALYPESQPLVARILEMTK
jgi:hypothetical protein